MIQCKLCGYWYYSITTGHLRVVHGLSGTYEYLKLFPEAEIRSEETKQLVSTGISRARLGQSLGSQSEDTKLLRSRSMKAFWEGLSLEEKAQRLAISFHQKGASERTGNTLRGVPRSGDCCRRIGESQRRFWASLSPEERLERARNSFLSKGGKLASQEAGRKCPNKVEEMLWDFLKESFPEIFVPHWVKKRQIGKRFPDFWSTNGYKLVLETMGDYWHGPERLDYDDEEVAIQNYREEGWDCIVVWASHADDIIVEWPTLKQRIMVEIEL